MLDITRKFKKPTFSYNHFLVILITVLFFSELAPYLYNKDFLSISLKHWAVINVFFAISLLVLNKQSIIPILSQGYFKWLFFFLILTLTWGWFSVALFGWYPEKGVDQFNAHILAILYLFSFAIILNKASAFRIARQLVLWIVILNVGINIYDFVSLNPEQFSHIPGRAAGMYGDPNNSSIVLCFGFVLTIGLVRPALKLPFTLWVFLGIILTQSRGGILVFLLIFSYYYFKKEYSRKSILKLGFIMLIVGTLITTYFLDTFQNEGQQLINNFDNLIERYDRVMNMIEGNSMTDVRVIVFQEYLEHWMQYPILGNGMGASYFYEIKELTHTISSHNQFLNLMVDFGIFGFILLIVFLWVLLTYNQVFLFYPEGLLFLLLFLLFAFTSHNMLDHYSLLFIYPMFGRLLQLKYEKGDPMLKLPFLTTKKNYIPIH